MFKKRETKYNAAYVDTEMVAFHVDAEDREAVVEYLLTTIITKCIIEFEETPEILE